MKTYDEEAKALASRIETPTLKQMAIDCMRDFRNEVDWVLDLVLDTLETRMESEEFVAFCDAL